jgi:hypothetical protein
VVLSTFKWKTSSILEVAKLSVVMKKVDFPAGGRTTDGKKSKRRQRQTRTTLPRWLAAFLRTLAFLIVVEFMCINHRNFYPILSDFTLASIVASIDDNKSNLVLDISNGLACLNRGNPSMNLTLRYPDDAYIHFLEIHVALKEWINRFAYHCAPKSVRKGRYCGPWIENHWIKHFNETAFDSSLHLADTFGPYIPLLIPWVDIWFSGGSRPKFPQEFVKLVESLLRPDVLYITVSQNDGGLAQNDGLRKLENVLVLSSGGIGHVPIPLLKQEESRLEHDVPMKDRKWLLSFAGTLTNGPIRKQMHEYLEGKANETYTFYAGDDWRSVMKDSCVSLAPRGTGRTSYRLMEILQAGFIPVHIYSDIPWVPYPKIFSNLGFSASIDNLPELLDILRKMTVEDFEQREVTIESYRESHLSVKGIMEQIGLFMKDAGDLACGLSPVNT